MLLNISCNVLHVAYTFIYFKKKTLIRDSSSCRHKFELGVGTID
uniref:Uncharacterized protein n=1 Tax=Anguilla anguilla TaxID=7936 RepID=A0A0E9RKP3_ANGAN